MPGPVFQGASYLDRPAIMCVRMRDSGLYHLVWAPGITRSPVGFTGPSPAVGWDRFAAGLRAGFTAGEAVPAPR
jgi:hypothetical protein